jgi:hypothetical protein
VCHDGNGPGTMVFSFAGTVYKYEETNEPLANAIVRLADAKNHQHVTGTNCAGNFFVQKTDFDPIYPVWVRLDFGEFPTEMTSPIYREGSCAACHSDPPTPISAGHVFLVNQGVDLPGGSCP